MSACCAFQSRRSLSAGAQTHPASEGHDRGDGTPWSRPTAVLLRCPLANCVGSARDLDLPLLSDIVIGRPRPRAQSWSFRATCLKFEVFVDFFPLLSSSAPRPPPAVHQPAVQPTSWVTRLVAVIHQSLTRSFCDHLSSSAAHWFTKLVGGDGRRWPRSSAKRRLT